MMWCYSSRVGFFPFFFFKTWNLEGSCHLFYCLPCFSSFWGNHARTRTSQSSLPCHCWGTLEAQSMQFRWNCSHVDTFPPLTTVIWLLIVCRIHARPMSLTCGNLARTIRKQHFPFIICEKNNISLELRKLLFSPLVEPACLSNLENDIRLGNYGMQFVVISLHHGLLDRPTDAGHPGFTLIEGTLWRGLSCSQKDPAEIMESDFQARSQRFCSFPPPSLETLVLGGANFMPCGHQVAAWEAGCQ